MPSTQLELDVSYFIPRNKGHTSGESLKHTITDVLLLLFELNQVSVVVRKRNDWITNHSLRSKSNDVKFEYIPYIRLT